MSLKLHLTVLLPPFEWVASVIQVSVELALSSGSLCLPHASAPGYFPPYFKLLAELLLVKVGQFVCSGEGASNKL